MASTPGPDAYSGQASASATLQTLVSFDGTNGSFPTGGLVVDAAGNLFGSTQNGGQYDYGTVFEIAKTQTGYATTPTTLITFDGNVSNGFHPVPVTMDAQGDLLGATFGVSDRTGPFVRGTIFELAKTGSGYAAQATTLVHFRQTGGHFPDGQLLLDAKGNIFGTTRGGQTANSLYGTIFEVAKTATGYRPRQKVLASFDPNAPSQPSSNLLFDKAGNILGALGLGGRQAGDVFKLTKTANGYSSTPTKISNAGGVTYLTMDKAGNLFAASGDGQHGYGAILELVKTGARYKTQTLASFDNTDGAFPTGLTFDAAGDLVGMTRSGGAYGKGTIFELAKTATGYSGSATTLYSFTGGADGATPTGELLLDSAGNFFGVTAQGGPAGKGTVFEFKPAAAGQPLCLVAGARVLTIAGEVAVEALSVGDVIVTASGARRPVTWLGHRRLARPAWQAQPVRIAAHAFGADRPSRPLLLSPGHPVLVGADADAGGGCLVPVMCLVNGTSITRMALAAVDYWHVELDGHDLLLAEGLAVESYIDCGDRDFFTKASDCLLANPDLVRPGMGARCRPVAIDGPRVEAERRRLDMVFAMRLAAACAWPEAASPAL